MRRLLGLLLALLVLCPANSAAATTATVVTDGKSSTLEKLASREVARYVYLRTGRLLSIEIGSRFNSSPQILVATKDRAIIRRLALDATSWESLRRLRPQEYVLRRLGAKLLVVGGDDVGTLYGAYRLAGVLGVRFYLHGDVIPDARIPFALPQVNETGSPNFALRGIQPFHDFPEGPDWWSQDDYLSVISQLAKLRMNFIGFHTYPEGGVGPEPLVWIGKSADVRQDGTVAFAYPAQWASTSRNGMWGYAAANTGGYTCGADVVFANDYFGPARQAIRSEEFNASGRMLARAFGLARRLGVKTCVGTETPLTVPKAVKQRFGQYASTQDLYRGMFTRIRRAYHADYYWLWTPEDWTWSGNTPEQLAKTVDDIKAADAALRGLGQPMSLATCGWVLGPQYDRAALDRLLPKSIATSTINREVGHARVEPGFAKIAGRSKWAIPWMENDPSLSAPQLWAGRMQFDAADAFRLGCDGLFGIHWRTKILAPTVSSLARAAWDPALRDPALTKGPANDKGISVTDGSMAKFSQAIEGTTEQPVYQTCRYGMSDYIVDVPNGIYDVTLKFAEPFYDHAGERVFSVLLDGEEVISELDILAKVGKNRALDFAFPNVAVVHGCVHLQFRNKAGLALISGIEVKDRESHVVRRINCGGPAFAGFEADENGDPTVNQARSLGAQAFYADFAKTNFGPISGTRIGTLLASIDGAALPAPAAWIDGPGGIRPNPAPWAEVAKAYQFVDELELAGRMITGKGERERFSYWLETFRYMRCMAEAGCLRGRLDELMLQVAKATNDDAKRQVAGKALSVRIALARSWERMMTHILQTVASSGELGTISNLEQHVRMQQHFLDAHDAELTKALGQSLPADVMLATVFTGDPRLTVLTVRSSGDAGERIRVPVLILGAGADARAELHVRRLGHGAFVTSSLRHVGRGAYEGLLPPLDAKGMGLEYYLTAKAEGGKRLVFPATAPDLCQTVIVMPRG